LLIASIAGTVSAPSLPDVILGCFLLFITLAIVSLFQPPYDA
jgi:hypothetical protein